MNHKSPYGSSRLEKSQGISLWAREYLPHWKMSGVSDYSTLTDFRFIFAIRWLIIWAFRKIGSFNTYLNGGDQSLRVVQCEGQGEQVDQSKRWGFGTQNLFLTRRIEI